MAQVLAVVPRLTPGGPGGGRAGARGHGPSGSISVEHVRNVLARLNPCHPSRPDLAASEPVPVADTARYDRLRPTHLDHVDGQEVGHARDTSQRCAGAVEGAAAERHGCGLGRSDRTR
jgi:hypothetical protein